MDSGSESPSQFKKRKPGRKPKSAAQPQDLAIREQNVELREKLQALETRVRDLSEENDELKEHVKNDTYRALGKALVARARYNIQNHCGYKALVKGCRAYGCKQLLRLIDELQSQLVSDGELPYVELYQPKDRRPGRQETRDGWVTAPLTRDAVQEGEALRPVSGPLGGGNQLAMQLQVPTPK